MLFIKKGRSMKNKFNLKKAVLVTVVAMVGFSAYANAADYHEDPANIYNSHINVSTTAQDTIAYNASDGSKGDQWKNAGHGNVNVPQQASSVRITFTYKNQTQTVTSGIPTSTLALFFVHTGRTAWDQPHHRSWRCGRWYHHTTCTDDTPIHHASTYQYGKITIDHYGRVRQSGGARILSVSHATF